MTNRKSETEIKIKIAMAEEASNKEKNLLCSSMDLERLVECSVWSVLLYGSETRSLRYREDRFEAFGMWIWRRMKKIKWFDRVSNNDVLNRKEMTTGTLFLNFTIIIS